LEIYVRLNELQIEAICGYYAKFVSFTKIIGNLSNLSNFGYNFNEKYLVIISFDTDFEMLKPNT
jgi:hypothetical protein